MGDRAGAPLVSVGMPVFNGARHVAQTIESLLEQTCDDFELIISDNASTDATGAICRSFAASDPRIRYDRLPENVGAAANYNRCVDMARGRFFKWASHDDLCEPTFLEACLEGFRTGPKTAVAVHPRSRFIDESGASLHDFGRSLDTRGLPPHRRAAEVIANVSLANPVFGLFRLEALRRTRLIDRFISSDYVLLVELALLGEIREVSEVLLLRRLHPGTSRQANRTRAEVARWFDPNLRVRRLELPPRWRVVAEYLRSVHRLVDGRTARAVCCATILATYTFRRVRVMGGMYKQALSAAAARRLRMSRRRAMDSTRVEQDAA